MNADVDVKGSAIDSPLAAMRRSCAVMTTVLAAIPWAALFAMAAAAIYVRLGFGRWPVVYMDDVNLPFVNAVSTVTVVAAISLIPSLLLFVVVVVAGWVAGLRPFLTRAMLIFIVGWVTAMAALRWTAIGTFLDWVMD